MSQSNPYCSQNSSPSPFVAAVLVLLLLFVIALPVLTSSSSSSSPVLVFDDIIKLSLREDDYLEGKKELWQFGSTSIFVVQEHLIKKTKERKKIKSLWLRHGGSGVKLLCSSWWLSLTWFLSDTTPTKQVMQSTATEKIAWV